MLPGRDVSPVMEREKKNQRLDLNQHNNRLAQANGALTFSLCANVFLALLYLGASICFLGGLHLKGAANFVVAASSLQCVDTLLESIAFPTKDVITVLAKTSTCCIRMLESDIGESELQRCNQKTWGKEEGKIR